MDMSQIVVDTSDWTDWPKPSPTSQYNINVRFYSSVDDDNGATVRVDVGVTTEAMLESLYEYLHLADRTQPISPVEFERYIRTVYATRIESMLPYTLQMAEYAVLTTDTREVDRALRMERQSVLRAIRLLPYRILPLLVPQPANWKERLERLARYAWLRLKFVFGR